MYRASGVERAWPRSEGPWGRIRGPKYKKKSISSFRFVYSLYRLSKLLWMTPDINSLTESLVGTKELQQSVFLVTTDPVLSQILEDGV